MRSAFGRSFVTASMVLSMGTPYAFAHVVDNILPGTPLLPPLKEEPEQLFDTATNDIVLQPQEHGCEELLALNHEAKHFLWNRIINFRVDNILPRIIGPECAIFGETFPLAVIRDPELLPGNTEEETLYYLPSMEAIFLGDAAHGSVWYALKTSGTGSFVEEFIARRVDAVQQVTFMESLDEAFRELRDTRASASKVSLFAAVSSEKALSSAERSETVGRETDSAQTSSSISLEQRGTLPSTQTEEIPSSAGAQFSGQPDTTETQEPTGPDNTLPVITAPEDQTENDTPVLAIVIAILTIIAVAAYAVYKLRKGARGTNDEMSDEPDAGTGSSPNPPGQSSP
ncbi:hypothetical protein FJZ28_00615 [Candidatus Peregrinibacteria bacterium]|nr:hypothetical protein [Candidatus Peregrinibacteria bacterium]